MRTTVVLLLAVGLTPGAVSAQAAPEPTPNPSASAPSQSAVDGAQRAVRQATARQKALQADLAAAQARLDAVTTKAEMATEAYNGARVQLAQRTAAAAKAAQLATQAQARAGRARGDVDDLAATLYMQGGTLGGLSQLFGSDTGDMARRSADVDAVSDYKHRTLVTATNAAAEAAAAKRAAAAAQVQQKAAAAHARRAFAAATAEQSAAAAEQASLANREKALVAELARLRRTSVALETRRQEALAEAAARRAQAAAAARAARAPSGSSGSAATASVAPGALPAPQRDAAARAIAFAQQQLNEPYLWAAEGPNSWDCSGLTKGAWAAAGRPLSHFSGAQYQETERVAIADLQPGDLVFFGSSVATIHHVGLYVGDGKMIEAPHAGAVVRYSTIYRNSLLPYGGRV